MPRYSEDFREQMVRKMMPPNAQSVAQVSRDSGVSEPTLYQWRDRYRKQGEAVPADPANPENWSGANKLATIIESAGLNEEELSAYCRRKGLYVEQIARWKAAAVSGNEPTGTLSKADAAALRSARKNSRLLEKELRRKEKALAEAAALLILQKKVHQIWGEAEDESS